MTGRPLFQHGKYLSGVVKNIGDFKTDTGNDPLTMSLYTGFCREHDGWVGHMVQRPGHRLQH